MASKNSCPISLGKLATLIVEVLSCGDMVKESPALPGGDEAGGEDDSVERYVIFAHELIQLNVLVHPPLLVVFLQQVCSDRDVPDWSVKPNVKYFLFESL